MTNPLSSIHPLQKTNPSVMEEFSWTSQPIMNEEPDYEAPRRPDIIVYKKEAIIFRPLELRLMESDESKKISPYVKIKIGTHRGKTHPATHGLSNPTWADMIVLEKTPKDLTAKIKVKDTHYMVFTNTIGETIINFEDALSSGNGRVYQWFNLYKDGQKTAEIHISLERTSLE